MESGHHLYYSGNTVKAPSPGKKRRAKNAQIRGWQRSDRHIRFEPKVCLTQRCVWCEHDFTQYLAVCPFCHNCQYCGQYGGSLFLCGRCGNHADEKSCRMTVFRA